MRPREDRDSQTLDIVGALLGATLLWGVPTALVAWLSHAADIDADPGPVLPVFWVVGYLLTIGLLLKRRREH